jgi:NAD(P)-dependent dehydrogenase (short-subunit alcohol dehydrogenase family)
MTASAGATYNFSDRVAVVTGGAGGFGRSVARRLLDAGAAVALWDARSDAVLAAAQSLGNSGRVLAQTVDVTDEDAVMAAALAVESRFGHIDTLVNNAGILGPVANCWEHTTAQFRQVVDVNLTGPFICCRVLVPYLLKNEYGPWRGRIVNVASIQGKEGMPQAAAYASSKAGLMALTKSLGKELAETGILVNVITPAAVLTDMSREISEDRKQSILARIPMGRFLTSDEVATQVAWLCSADCSFATGAVFDLSGGRATY